jgi:hypothetical protein
MNKLIFGTMASGLLAAAANGVIIDTFDISQSAVATMGGGDQANTAAGASILGGERELFSDHMMGGGSISAVSNAAADGLLSFSSDAGTFGMGKIVWDGNDNNTGVFNPTGLGGVDFTEGGSHDRLVIRVYSADLPAELRFTFYTDAGNTSEASLMIPGGIFAPGGDVELPYASFTTMAGAGADWTNIGAIRMEILPSGPDTDLRIDFLQTATPAPGALAIAGFAGMLGARRRRR